MNNRFDGLNVIADDIERTAEERKTDENNRYRMSDDGELEGAACDALHLLVLDRDRMSVSDRINLCALPELQPARQRHGRCVHGHAGQRPLFSGGGVQGGQ